jgi:hypothetical protein
MFHVEVEMFKNDPASLSKVITPGSSLLRLRR